MKQLSPTTPQGIFLTAGEWLPWVLLPLSVFAAYASTLNHPWVYDDSLTILNNPSLKQFTVETLRYQMFRPLVNISYAIDFAFSGTRGWGYHFTNILLHAVNTLLAYALARTVFEDVGGETSRRRYLAWGVAAVFALHPLQTEAVTYVSARSELLCFLFFAPAFLLARRALATGNIAPLAAALGFWLLALASKEVAAVLPLVVLTDKRLVVQKSSATGKKARVYGVLFGVLLVGVAARLFVFLTREQVPHLPLFATVFQQCDVVLRYVRLVFLPWGQSLVHPIVNAPEVSLRGLVSAAFWIAALVWAWRLRRTAPAFVLGLAWFLLWLAPSSVAPLNEPMAEHRVYGALFGLAMGCASLLLRFSVKRNVAVAASGLLLISLFVLTVKRNQVWASELTLWGDAASKAPQVWAARYAHGDALRAARLLTEAADEYRAAVQLVPDRPEAWNNLGIVLAEQGRFSDALTAFRRAIALNPNDASTARNLSQLETVLGQARLPPQTP